MKHSKDFPLNFYYRYIPHLFRCSAGESGHFWSETSKTNLQTLVFELFSKPSSNFISLNSTIVTSPTGPVDWVVTSPTGPVDWVVTSPTRPVDWVVTSPTRASLHHPPAGLKNYLKTISYERYPQP